MALPLESTLKTLTEAHKQLKTRGAFVISKGKLRGSEKAVHILFSIHKHLPPGRTMKEESGLANYVFWINLYSYDKIFSIINVSWLDAMACYAASNSHIYELWVWYL